MDISHIVQHQLLKFTYNWSTKSKLSSVSTTQASNECLKSTIDGIGIINIITPISVLQALESFLVKIYN